MTPSAAVAGIELPLANFIGGAFIAAGGVDSAAVINPATEEVIARVPCSTSDDLDRAVDAASAAFEDWGRTTPQQRSALLLAMADALEAHGEEFARLESLNVGKTMTQARAEVAEAADITRFFAGAARCLEGIASGDYRQGYTSLVRREPLGVVGLVSPWNFPLMIAATKIAPALAAGNTVVFKPSELTPLTTLRLASMLGGIFPAGVVNVVLGAGDLGAAIARHPGIQMVSFTGGTATGRNVAREAAGNLKRLSMELGGKAPVIVLDDADVDAVAARLRAVSFINSGQACTAACRVIAQGAAYERLLEVLVPTVESIRVGDPSDPDVEMGPVVSSTHQNRVLAFFDECKGEILTGGTRLGDRGFFVKPTVVAGVGQHDRIVQEEIFGPVITVQRLDGDDNQALTWANDVPYGLSGSVWTHDIKRALNIIQRLDFGQVWVNDHLSSVPELPNGGFKASGYGTDSSVYALADYTRVKHVWLAVT